MSRLGPGLEIKGQEFRGKSVRAEVYKGLLFHASKITQLMREPQSQARDKEIQLHVQEIRPQMNPDEYEQEVKKYDRRKARDPTAIMSHELELEMAKREVLRSVAYIVGGIVGEQQEEGAGHGKTV